MRVNIYLLVHMRNMAPFGHRPVGPVDSSVDRSSMSGRSPVRFFAAFESFEVSAQNFCLFEMIWASWSIKCFTLVGQPGEFCKLLILLSLGFNISFCLSVCEGVLEH